MKTNLLFRLIFAQSLDAATFAFFYIYIGASVHAERNPLILLLMAVGGIWAVAGAKIALAGWVAYRSKKEQKPSRFAFVRAMNRYLPANKLLVIGISVATAAGIVGAGFNTASILNSMTGIVIR